MVLMFLLLCPASVAPADEFGVPGRVASGTLGDVL